MHFALSFPIRPKVARFERSGTDRLNRTFHPCPLGQGYDEEVHAGLSMARAEAKFHRPAYTFALLSHLK